MKYQGTIGKLRKAMDKVGMNGKDAWIFNDLRRKSGTRRLKIWSHFRGDVSSFIELQSACQSEFGWNMIACSLIKGDRGQVNFIVKLKA